MEDAAVATKGPKKNGNNPSAAPGIAAAAAAATVSFHTSNGVTNPLLPRSLGHLGLQRPRSAFDPTLDKESTAKSPFKSRFLGKRSKQSQERSPPTTPDSGVASPPTFVNRSSSGSSSTSTTSNNSSGYCTYSNENGVLRFTLKEKTVLEEENMGNRMPMAGIEKSKSRILVEEEMYDTVTEPLRLPNKPFLDLSRRNSKGERRSVGREIRGSSVGREGSKEPDRLSKTISEFMQRSEERMRDWKVYEKKRMSAAGSLGAMSLAVPPPPRAQSVARATSVDRDDEYLYNKRVSYPQRAFGTNRNARAASVARDDIFNEMQSQNLRRPLFVRGASVARDSDVSNEDYLSSVRESLYNQTGSRFLRSSPARGRDAATPLRERGTTPLRQRDTTPLQDADYRNRGNLNYDEDVSVSYRVPPMRGSSVARDSDVSGDVLGYRRTADARNYRSQSVVPLQESRFSSRLRSPLRDDSDYPTGSDSYSGRLRSPLREASSNFDNSRYARGSSRRTPVRDDLDAAHSRASLNPRFQSRITPMRDLDADADYRKRRNLDYDEDISVSYRVPPMRGSSVARDSDVSSDLLGYRRTADARNYRSQSVVQNRPSYGAGGGGGGGYGRDVFDPKSLTSDHYSHSYREPLNYYARGRSAVDEDATIRAAPPPKFLSLEEECNWILSGKVQPQRPNGNNNLLLRAPVASQRRSRSKNGGGGGDTLNDLLSANAASDEEDTLDDISGDEVNQSVTDSEREDGEVGLSERVTRQPVVGSSIAPVVSGARRGLRDYDVTRSYFFRPNHERGMKFPPRTLHYILRLARPSRIRS